MTPQERIKADAEAYALPMVWVNQNPKGEEQLFYEYISSTSYIAGATVEHDRAQALVDALENAKKQIHELCMTIIRLGYTPFNPISEINEALEQWKGKEGEPPKPVASNCGMCGKLGNNQYLGNQFYLCDECFEDYEKGRDQPTPY